MTQQQVTSEDRSGLTTGDLTRLRERLLGLRQKLLERLVEDQSVIREAEHLTEPLDAAEQTREQDDGVTFASHDRALLAEVERALAKLQTGRYGTSEASGEPIGLRRLEAVPWARYTVDEEEESKAFNDGDG
jgi:DnaK suppressor protein